MELRLSILKSKRVCFT